VGAVLGLAMSLSLVAVPRFFSSPLLSAVPSSYLLFMLVIYVVVISDIAICHSGDCDLGFLSSQFRPSHLVIFVISVMLSLVSVIIISAISVPKIRHFCDCYT
jgi:uncharacterized membrane protein YidH (DUF202 family)